MEKIHGCVHKDTLILLSDGTEKPIYKILPNDNIITYNENTHRFESNVVTKTFVKPANETLKWYELTFDNGRQLICTEDHPILTTKGWVEAQNLTNDHILL